MNIFKLCRWYMDIRLETTVLDSIRRVKNLKICQIVISSDPIKSWLAVSTRQYQLNKNLKKNDSTFSS